jgi:plasmid stabilization system protein ParE
MRRIYFVRSTKHPLSWQRSRFAGDREEKTVRGSFVLAPLPYLVVYRVENDSIQVLRILHGAQKWP